VVPSCNVGVGKASAVIAWRLTVHQAFCRGRPWAGRSQVRRPGLVRDQGPVPAIAGTQACRGR
jgi:hypothetical protein